MVKFARFCHIYTSEKPFARKDARMALPQPPYPPQGSNPYPNAPPGYAPNAPQGYPPQAYYPPPPGYYAPPPPRKSNKRLWWIIGGAVGAFLILVVVGIILLVTTLLHTGGPARDASVAYFAAVKAHDWPTAYDKLSASLQATTKPADLQATWTRREQANGPIDHFNVTNTNVNNTNGKVTATVTGTLVYASGTSDPKVVTLVKENGNWKLSQLP
jgi:hypothetical protein